MARAMRFFERIHGVYFDDLDAFQILHNARYVVLMERTIGSFWRHLGVSGLLDFNAHPDMCHLVRANHIQYERPVQGIGEVRVRSWVERMGETSITFGFRILPLDQDVDHAKGGRVLVRIDPETRRPVPWTDTLRQQLAPYRRDLL